MRAERRGNAPFLDMLDILQRTSYSEHARSYIVHSDIEFTLRAFVLVSWAQLWHMRGVGMAFNDLVYRH